MKTEYAHEVLQSIENQEFYNNILEYTESELFEDIIDFMEIFQPSWYKELGTWTSELIHTHITCYFDLYSDPEESKKVLLYNLYLDLADYYEKAVKEYKFVIQQQEILQNEYESFME